MRELAAITLTGYSIKRFDFCLTDIHNMPGHFSSGFKNWRVIHYVFAAYGLFLKVRKFGQHRLRDYVQNELSHEAMRTEFEERCLKFALNVIRLVQSINRTSVSQR